MLAETLAVLVGTGSSLPEIATAIYGAASGHGSLVVGHVVGCLLLYVPALFIG